MIFPGFVGPSYTTQSLNANVERLMNLYPERGEDRDAPSYVLYGTPGLSLLLTAPDTPIRGQFQVNGRAYAVAGAQFGETSTGVFVFIGFVFNDNQPVSWASNGIGGNQILIISGGLGYIFNTVTSAFAVIADPDFPINAVQCGFLDGYFLVLAPSQFNISALNDGTTWSALDKAQRSIAADTWIAMLITQRYVWLLGSQTSEVWYDSGAASFPFAPIPGAFVQQGIAGRWTLTAIDNSVGWLGQNVDGQRMVFIADQFVPRRVSTHAVETSLMTCSSVADFKGWTYQEQGHTFYVLTSWENQMTWVYDVGEGLWHERSFRNYVSGQDEAIRGANHILYNGQHWVGDRQNGRIYIQSLGQYTDIDFPIRSVRRFPHIINEQKRMYYDRFQLDFQPGGGSASGTYTAPQFEFRWSNDGGYNWSNYLYGDVGALGAYSTRAIWNRLGTGRNRVFELAQVDPSKRCWTAGYLEARAGLS